jgi:hypothetical protein
MTRNRCSSSSFSGPQVPIDGVAMPRHKPVHSSCQAASMHKNSHSFTACSQVIHAHPANKRNNLLKIFKPALRVESKLQKKVPNSLVKSVVFDIQRQCFLKRLHFLLPLPFAIHEPLSRSAQPDG